jgi:hypothetical protein
MFHGFQGDYRWLESISHGIDDLLRVCPEAAAGKSWAVTAFDQDRLNAVAEDDFQSWQVSGSALLIPPLDDLHQLPHNIFQELYTFTAAVPQRKFHTFIRHDWFTLGPTAANRFQARNVWDFKRMQRLFWQEMEAISPESYIASGQRLIFATRNPLYFTAVLRGLGGAPVKTGST